MTKKEEAWVNAVIATLMSRPSPSPEHAFDTSDVVQDVDAIRADERERIASILEKNRYHDVHAELIAWLRAGGR